MGLGHRKIPVSYVYQGLFHECFKNRRGGHAVTDLVTIKCVLKSVNSTFRFNDLAHNQSLRLIEWKDSNRVVAIAECSTCLSVMATRN